jgi:hypothetical protein
MIDDVELARLQNITDERDVALDRIGRATRRLVSGLLASVLGFLFGGVMLINQGGLLYFLAMIPGAVWFTRGLAARNHYKRELRETIARLDLPSARIVSAGERFGG